jgi:O-antigen/teichoic acid export membrane protein
MLKRNLFYTLTLSLSQFVFPLVTFPYSSRILGPRGIGTVNFIDSFTQYFLLFAALGIPTYGIREIARHRKDPEGLNKLFSEIFAIHLISTLFFSTVYFVTALLLPAVCVHLNLVFTGMLLLLFSVLTVEWFYSGIEQFSYITLRSLLVRSLGVILLFVALKPSTGANIYYLIFVFPVALTGLLNLYNLRKHVKIRFKGLDLKKHFKPLVILLGSALAVSVYVFMDNIILGFIKGDEAVGIYSTATKIVKIPFAILMAINAVIIPQVSLAFHEGRLEMVQKLIDKSFAFLSIIGLPITVGIAVCGDFLVRTFAGSKFLNAVPVLQILSPVTIVVGMTFIFAAQLLTPLGREGQLLKISIAGMLFSLAANLFLIPWLSYAGAAITNVLTELLVACLCYRLLRKSILIHFDLKIFTMCLIGAFLFIPIAFFIRRLDLSGLSADVALITTCAASYIVYLWFFVKNIYLDQFKNTVLSRLGLINQVQL